MITPDMLTWKPYTIKDDNPMVIHIKKGRQWV